MKPNPFLIIPFYFYILIASTTLLSDEITIFGNEFEPPKIYNENGEQKGILIELLRYIEQETDHTFNIRLYPWNRVYAMGLKSKGGVAGLSMTNKRLKIFDYSNVFFLRRFDDCCSKRSPV